MKQRKIKINEFGELIDCTYKQYSSEVSLYRLPPDEFNDPRIRDVLKEKFEANLKKKVRKTMKNGKSVKGRSGIGSCCAFRGATQRAYHEELIDEIAYEDLKPFIDELKDNCYKFLKFRIEGVNAESSFQMAFDGNHRVN